jgi:cobalt-zinc-cadmium efflux system membrane fusion protein
MLLASVAVTGACNRDGDKSTGGANSTGKGSTGAAKPATQQLVPTVKLADWCPEHGIPESVCTRCNASLIADFKKKGDWCKEHNLPESQCLSCHPELKEKFEAMRPKT